MKDTFSLPIHPLPAQTELVDIVVPVLNEIEMLPVFLRRMDALTIPSHLIFVDNGSSDGTLDLLRTRKGITLLTHNQNLGYGQSLIDGLKASLAERVVIIDADCEYPPEAIPELLAALEKAAVVYGSRFLGNREIDMSPTRQWGNKVLTRIYNLLYNQGLTDLYTGMKALHKEAFQGLHLRRSGFDHVVELAIGLARRGCRIIEIPVTYTPRQTGSSKMRHLSETVKALWLMMQYRFNNHE